MEQGILLIPGVGRKHYRASIAFDPSAYKYIFKDFKESPVVRETCLTQPPAPISDFLEQFDDISWQWANCYERATADIIKHCAQYQAILLNKNAAALEAVDREDDSLLIALILRCLVLTHEIFSLDACVPYRMFEENELQYDCDIRHESDAHMKVWTTATH